MNGYETPEIKDLGSLTDLTQGAAAPNVTDVMIAGNMS
jgi:hypothetical protein